ncbi:hypothetical protein JB92DRAFT_2833942 [Gautieria morchelliformis]|nr:hypothetical protein JB92DRAFT_2833942 [Gautieria morchelliformis]
MCGGVCVCAAGSRFGCMCLWRQRGQHRGRGLPLLVREAVVVASRSNSTRAAHFFSSPPLLLSPIDVPVHCTHPLPFHVLPLALLSTSTTGSRGAKQHTPCTRWYLSLSELPDEFNACEGPSLLK